jgi:type IV secretory pathway VirB2 component (pilin)
MSFRAVNQRWLIPVAQTLMVLGIIALCQPWVEVLHRYGVTIILIGLVSFMVTTKIPAPPSDNDGGGA